MISSWHKGALQDTNNFLTTVQRSELTVVSEMDWAVNKAVTQNREKLFPILSSILFCCSHDIALRGRESTSGNLCDLLRFRIEAGDTVLKDHMEGSNKNARNTSVRVQNELIVLTEEVVRDNIVKAANESNGFSIIADKTADISGTEQLSIGVRFVALQEHRNDSATIREEFLGFIYWIGWTLQQLQILSSTKQNNLVLTSRSSTAKATILNHGRKREWCTSLYQEILSQSCFRALLFTSTEFGGSWSELCHRCEEYDWNCEIYHKVLPSQAQETGSKYTFVVWNQMERKVQKHLFRELLWYICTTGGKPAWVTEYAS